MASNSQWKPHVYLDIENLIEQSIFHSLGEITNIFKRLGFKLEVFNL